MLEHTHVRAALIVVFLGLSTRIKTGFFAPSVEHGLELRYFSFPTIKPKVVTKKDFEYGAKWSRAIETKILGKRLLWKN